MKSILIPFCLLLTFSTNSFAQKPKYDCKCELLQHFFDSSFQGFMKRHITSIDSPKTIIDLNHLLAKCHLLSYNGVVFRIIDSGKIFEETKESIFNAPFESSYVFVLVEAKHKGKNIFSIFHTSSSGIIGWQFRKEGEIYYFIEENTGYF